MRCYIQITISEGDTRKILRVFSVGSARKWRFLFHYGGITTRRHQQQYGENWKILNWRRFLELSNWNLKTWPGILERDLSVTLHISAASSFNSLDVMQHTYLTKMFNERVTDSISCDQKTFLRRTAFRWSLNKYCFKMLFTWYVIGQLNQELVGAVIDLLWSERNRFLWKVLHLFYNLGVEMVLGQRR